MDYNVGFVELEAIKMMEQPIKDLRNIKITKTLTPIEMHPQLKGNECIFPKLY